MQNSNLYFTLFQKISEHLTILLNIQPKKKAGRLLKVSDLQLAALYITSYISNTPILTLRVFQNFCKLTFLCHLEAVKPKDLLFWFFDLKRKTWYILHFAQNDIFEVEILRRLQNDNIDFWNSFFLHLPDF
jgi:hypothetical protein